MKTQCSVVMRKSWGLVKGSMMEKLAYIGLVVLFSAMLLFVVVEIMNMLDTSPTEDERCRGGHDF